MENKILIFGHKNPDTDTICSALIEKVEEGQEVILVDHNEFNQSVEGIEKAKILEVVDHHRISNFETSEPLYYTARPFGCTSTILFEEFKQNNI